MTKKQKKPLKPRSSQPLPKLKRTWTRQPPVETTCSFCLSSILVPKYKHRYRVKLRGPAVKFFCNKDCADSSLKTNTPKICARCGGEFYTSISQDKYRPQTNCSLDCSLKTKGIHKMKRKKQKGESKQALQNIINRYCRLRDCAGNGGAACISCQKWFPFEDGDGGHFVPTTSGAIRFDERNINFQCRRCNRYLHGNPRHYLKGMLKKYGQDVVDELESKEFEAKKWKPEEIKELRKIYNGKIKALQTTTTRQTESGTGLEVLEMFGDMGTTGEMP